jgi:hypothetical protein
LGVEQCVQTLKDKGMHTQYEVNNFSKVNFLSKFEFFSSSMVWIWPIYSLLEGSIQNISNIWKVKDHGSRDVTWKPDTIF